MAKSKSFWQENKVNLIGWIVILLVIVGVVLFASNANKRAEEVKSTNLQITEADRIKGPEDAPVTLVEYADFQCPACAAYAPMIDGLFEGSEGKLRIVYRHFPLMSIHPNAFPAAVASEAAGEQGKFWEMHDLLFARQQEWANSEEVFELFAAYAESLELDPEKFEADINSLDLIAKVQADLANGTELGVDSTPTFYLDGEKLSFARGVEDMLNKIRSKIADTN